MPDNKPKTFYFGMNEFSNDITSSRNVGDVKKFTENYTKSNHSPSDSLTSNEPSDEVRNIIVLNLSVILIYKSLLNWCTFLEWR